MSDIKLNANEEKELAEMGYNCRVCGKFVHSLDEVPLCIHCHAPTCSKCTSCSFCLNCYLNISEDGRKTLKLLKNLIWFMPLIGFLVLIQGWQKFLIAEIVIITLFSGLYFYSRYQINRKSGRYFNPKWEITINSADYIPTKDLGGHKPLVDSHVDNQLNTMWKKADSNTDQKNKLKSLSNVMKNEELERYEFLLGEERPPDGNVSGKNIEQLKQHKCPLCGVELEFNEFCIECQRRFCPQCGEDLNPFAERCLCGQKLSPLFPNDDVKGGSISLMDLIESASKQTDGNDSDTSSETDEEFDSGPNMN